MIQTSQKHRLTGIIFISCIACLFMISIELILQPSYWTKSMLKLGIFLFSIIVYSLIFNPNLKILEYDKKNLKISICIAVVVYVLIIATYAFLDQYIDTEQIKNSLMGKEHINRSNFIYVAMYITIVNSFIEEAFFRGFIFLNIKALGYVKWSAVYSALLFSLYHIGIMSNWFNIYLFLVTLLALFGAGILLNWFAYKGKSFLASWPIHIAANLGINTIGFLIL